MNAYPYRLRIAALLLAAMAGGHLCCHSNAVTSGIAESSAIRDAGSDAFTGDGVTLEPDAGADCATPDAGADCATCAPPEPEVPAALRPLEGRLVLPLPARDELPFEITATKDEFTSDPWR